jgi:hypothetical protein
MQSLQRGWLRARSEAEPLDEYSQVGRPQQAAMSEDREGM